MEIFTLANVAFYGWILAILLWAVVIYFWFKPQISLKEASMEIYYIVEQIDLASEGAIKGQSKWVIYKTILCLVARAMGKIAATQAEQVGKEAVAQLKDVKTADGTLKNGEEKKE